MGWEKRDVWVHQGSGYRVEIYRWDNYDNNIWNIYVYVYPGHKLFSKLRPTDDMDAGDILPFHGGCTYFRVHRDKETITSYQLGCDYNHSGDKEYLKSLALPAQVLADAEELVTFMEVYDGQNSD